MSEEPGTPSANWYPDGSGQLRYWDGAAWTDHVHPLVDGSSSAPDQRVPIHRRPVVLVAAGVVLVLLVALGVVLRGGSGGGSLAGAGAAAGATTPADSGAQTVSRTVVLSCQPSSFPIETFAFPLTLTATPSAASSGSVTVSVTAGTSIRNTGPATIRPGTYRFQAAVTVDGRSVELLGPRNTTSSTGSEGAQQPLYTGVQLPLVARGTVARAAHDAPLRVVLTDLYFNNLDNGTTGGPELGDVFDARCNPSPAPNTAPRPIGLALSVPAVATTP